MTTIAYDRVTIGEFGARMGALHQLHAENHACDCGPGQPLDCTYFALLRLRGICHIVYVVHETAGADCRGWRYRVVDVLDSGGPYAAAEISEPVESFGDAVLAAVRLVVLEDEEIAETLTETQVDALASTF